MSGPWGKVGKGEECEGYGVQSTAARNRIATPFDNFPQVVSTRNVLKCATHRYPVSLLAMLAQAAKHCI
eukprot:CAMPEP_0115883262 /NCGR_PEP_ID=MMETSP0287-20121206/29473_1 /TAXON_ID=412157 /ORGANISM="Chrysochromulina rotalis, Strain UIO044" /LENGTH=68 /DNA_ID=CAMNT_0003339453 /DNA_START=527 /DNA_END=733 /DNA_ORIENTATION=-